MFFYVSVRPVNTNGKRLLLPTYALRDNFPGLILSWKCIASSTKTDGRWLYEIEVESIEHRDIILEGLQMWGCHLKSEQSTVELSEILTNRKDITMNLGRLIIPNLFKEKVEVEGYGAK